jgi:DNA-binding LacI/PurR family transcriptional regulator
MGPAIAKSIDFLRRVLAAETLKPGDAIPSLRILAGHARVSRNSMWKAVRILAREGVLTVIGGGTISVTTKKSDALPARPLRLWQEKRIALVNDIADGRFRDGSLLPSTKELCVRYNISAVTMRKGLTALLTAGVIVRRGRSFAVPSVRLRRFRSTIIAFSTHVDAIAIDVVRERMKSMVDVIEKECARQNLRARFIGIQRERHGETLRMIERFRGDDSVIGYVFNLWVIMAWQRGHHDYARALVSHGKPVAVMDHSSKFPLESTAFAWKSVRVFRTGSKAGGRCVGDFLFDLGHRSVAYLSLWHGNQWSVDRLDGLQEVYRQAGLDKAVAAFAEDDNPGGGAALFSRVLKHSFFSAWVCATDRLALEAKEFLAGRTIDVPGRISVLGFDNTVRSFEEQLTSVDFNLEAINYRMVRYLLNPTPLPIAQQREPVEIEPTLIRRESVGDAGESLT